MQQILFNRQGVERAPNMGPDRYTYVGKCGRCGGIGGSSGWPGYFCFDCRGSGRGQRQIERLYNKETLDKLNAAAERRAQAKAAKVAAEKAEVEAARASLRDSWKVENQAVLAKLDDLIEWTNQDAYWVNLKLDLVTRVSLSASCENLICERHVEWKARREAVAKQRELGHFGEVGQRYTVKACVVRTQFIDTISRYPLIERWLVQLRTEEGYVLTWWTSHRWDLSEEYEECRVTVKKHDEFNGLPQTVVQRVAFTRKTA